MWLENEPSEDLVVYVVWSTQLGAREEHVPEAAALMPDSRALHYWDPSLSVGRAVSPHLELEDPAWDVWLLYDRDAAWGDEELPGPAWWEHQLSVLADQRRLDPERFARRAREALGEAP